MDWQREVNPLLIADFKPVRLQNSLKTKSTSALPHKTLEDRGSIKLSASERAHIAGHSFFLHIRKPRQITNWGKPHVDHVYEKIAIFLYVCI